MVVRDEELPELDTLQREACPYPVKGGAENKHGKANTLLQVGPGGRGCSVAAWLVMLWCSEVSVWCLKRVHCAVSAPGLLQLGRVLLIPC